MKRVQGHIEWWVVIFLSALVGLFALACLSGCNSSPAQVNGEFSLFTFDNRHFYEVVGNVTNEVSRPSGGHGSNSRVYADVIQSQVLYKSPLSASSNSTDVSASIPLVK